MSTLLPSVSDDTRPIADDGLVGYGEDKEVFDSTVLTVKP